MKQLMSTLYFLNKISGLKVNEEVTNFKSSLGGVHVKITEKNCYDYAWTGSRNHLKY